MKRPLFLLLIFTIFTLQLVAQDGPTNNEIKWQVDIESFVGLLNDEGNDNEYRLRTTALLDTDGVPSTLDVDNINNAICIELDDASAGAGIFPYLVTGTVTTGNAIDIIANAFEDDGVDDCKEGSLDDHMFTFSNLVTIDKNFLGSNTFSSSHPNGSAGYRIYWRYVHGDVSSPLDFGILNLGDKKEHYNTNEFSPTVAEGTQGVHSSELVYAAQNVRYSFTLNTAMRVNINTDHPQTTHPDTYLSIAHANSTFIAANDNISSINKNSSLTLNLNPGTYLVDCGNISGAGSNGGEFNLTIQHAPEMACDNITTLDVDCNPTISGITNQDLARSCLSAELRLGRLYEITPSTDAEITIELIGLQSDVDLYVFDAPPCPGSSCNQVAGSAVGGTSQETAIFTPVAGQTYYVSVRNFSIGQSSTFDLVLTTNSCQAATDLGLVTHRFNLFPVSKTCIAAEALGPSCGPDYEGGDNWYTCIVPDSGSIVWEANLSETLARDVGLEVFSDCSGTSPIACVSQFAQPLSQALLTGLPAGERIYLRFWIANNIDTEFTMALRDPCPGNIDLTDIFLDPRNVESGGTITSSIKLPTMANARYSATDAIFLKAGFEVRATTTFEAVMEGCVSN